MENEKLKQDAVISFGGNKSINNSAYYQYGMLVKQTLEENDKYKEFKTRIDNFKDVSTLKEALELADKVLPTKNEITRFNIGSAQCIVVKKADCFRITMDSPKEFICYDFV